MLQRLMIVLSTALLLSLQAHSGLAHEGEEHGDHNPHHHGFVLMYQDLHFEVAAPAAGGVEVYFTDAVRADLPAVIVSDLGVEIEKADGSIEPVNMNISPSGDHWRGDSRPIQSVDSIIRIAFVYQDEPFLIDLPASYLPTLNGEAMAMEHDEHHGHHDH